jgi:hypothetical protein
MPGIQIDNDNAEIRVGGQEYVSTKTSAINCFGTVTDGNNSAVADQYNDTLTISPGTGIGVVIAAQSDTVTITNNGVTTLNGGTGARFTYSTFTDGITPTSASSGHVIMTLAGTGGINVVTSTDTATISMSQVSIVKPSNSIIDGAQAPSPVAILTTGLIPTLSTIEISGVIWLAFSNAAGSVNTYEVSLTTTTGTIGTHVSRAAIGFSCHAGPNLSAQGEATKAQNSFTYPQQIANANLHTIRFSGMFQTDAQNANSLIINIKNNNTTQSDQLVVYAKSFLKYNII